MSDMAEAREGKAQKSNARKDAMTRQVEAVLGHPHLNDELRRKLAYCQQQIAGGRTDAFILGLRTDFLKQARKTMY